MNKTTDATDPKDKTKPGTEDSKEPKEDAFPKGERVDPEKLLPTEKGGLVKPVLKPSKKVSPEDASLHVHLTDEKFTSVKEFHDKLVRIERMLEWLIVQRVTDDQKLIKQPNIADIFREIASKIEDEKKEKKEKTEEEKEDEVPPTT